MDWRARDFHLSAESPAIDAGSQELAPATDIQGVSRPQGAGIDLGAYEFLPPTRVEKEKREVLSSFENFPNPFNSGTTIHYQLAKPSHVRLAIYDILGRQRLVLVQKDQPAGTYRLIWDGRDAQGIPLASNLYFLRLETGSSITVRKILLPK